MSEAHAAPKFPEQPVGRRAERVPCRRKFRGSAAGSSHSDCYATVPHCYFGQKKRAWVAHAVLALGRLVFFLLFTSKSKTLACMRLRGPRANYFSLFFTVEKRNSRVRYAVMGSTLKHIHSF
jgi:hypothetical protein